MSTPDSPTDSTQPTDDPKVYEDERGQRWRKIIDKADVTYPVRMIAENVEEDWFSDKEKIDWSDFWDRLEGSFLPDGTRIDLGNSFDTPAMKELKKHIRTYREMG